MGKNKTVFTTGEVARICQVAARTVSKWFDSGQLRGYRIPGSRDRRIPLDELLRFMKLHDMPTDGLVPAVTQVLLAYPVGKDTEAIAAELSHKVGYDVHVANNPFAIGLALQRFAPEVVVVRVDSRDESHLSTCAAIRDDEEFQATRLVAGCCGDAKAVRKLGDQNLFDDVWIEEQGVLELIKTIEQLKAIVY